MCDKKITIDEVKDVLYKNPGISNYKAAEILGVVEGTVRRYRKQLAAGGWSPEHDMTKTVPEGFGIKGISTLYNGEGGITAQWVKSVANKEQQIEVIKAAFEAMCEDLPKITQSTIMNEHEINDNLLSVYNWGDMHIAMLAWGDECGADWDLKIAEEVFCKAAIRIVKGAPRSKEALIINLGDMLHYDNMDGVTARSGHHLDCDGRYAKMVRVAVKVMRQMIEAALAHHEKVTVINEIGNHDDTGAFFMSIALDNIYENESRVTIDTSPAPFHYYRFGKVLIGTHHGHTTKQERLPGVMATDKAKDWGDTEYRYWFCGHLHHSSKKEYSGCTVEIFRTLAAKDAYATWGGYRAGQDTTCIIMHKDYGEVARNTVNLQMLLDDY